MGYMGGGWWKYMMVYNSVARMTRRGGRLRVKIKSHTDIQQFDNIHKLYHNINNLI